MTRYKSIRVSEDFWRQAKLKAVSKNCSIINYLDSTLSEDAKEAEKKVKSYGLFK